MPYKLSLKGRHLVDTGDNFPADLTEHQEQALIYLDLHRHDGYIESSEVAKYYGLAPQAMRGPLASLYKRGYVEKKED